MLSSRMRSYELAARMQLSVPEVSNINGEPEHIRRQYGMGESRTEDAGRRCLLARRLLERGVRFVQLLNGTNVFGEGEGNWDGHKRIKKQYDVHGRIFDQPTAALLRDLKQRGLLERTLVVFGTEFGRTPGAQGNGRDHHPQGFTCWLAGGGIKAGITHGATDELGYYAVEHPHYVADIHATVLHQLGLNSHRLEVPGRKRIDFHRGQPIQQIIA